MTSFDLSYANYENERVDFIIQTSGEMMCLYRKLTDACPTENDIRNLRLMYKDVSSEISSYYSYLKKEDIPTEESYLTHWLENMYYTEYYANIEAYLGQV